jgi:lipopolysaccharide transport system ATP-binding protein
MADLTIRVEGLGKQYRIGSTRESYSTLRDQIQRWTSLSNLFGGRTKSEPTSTFWALKDVSFDVRRGDVVGIIGRNGAGKSTLLKVLSRITEPTEGQADIHGRVGSLLEVGTGFHPELTGRENVFLNGAILGMKRAEILRKFDQIVTFAEVEKFIDTPVKYYSSGMYMRLAFAVAAHLEPEILVVDEVLAVGDAKFQKKCLGTMNEIARGGRTVLLVSHNMQTIATLCRTVLCLHNGRVDFFGPVSEGIARYYATTDSRTGDAVDPSRRPGSGAARFVSVEAIRSQFRPEEAKRFRFRVRRNDPTMRRCFLSAHLVNQADQIICQCDSRFVETELLFGGDEVAGELTIRLPWLKPGEYAVDFFLMDGRAGVVDRHERACFFDVFPVLPYSGSAPEDSMSHGLVLGDFEWSMDGA